MHELPLLLNIAVALSTALAGGLMARWIGLPTLVGYLLAGVAIGPATPGFVGDAAAIGQLAELGVVFLMFGVGMHFSLRDLWRVKEVAVPGAVAQTALATLFAYLLARSWGWTPTASLVLGLSASVASTVVLLRVLMDLGLLRTRHGQIAVGWLVLEDIATVLLLLVLPALAPSGEAFAWRSLAPTLAKAVAFIALMLLLGKRVVPWFLMRIAHTRSRELFVLVALTVALGIALAAAQLFGVSLALGAFLAGVVVRESPFSHQVGADLLPFREAFAVLFFVSVGMLVDPGFLLANLGRVLALSTVVVVGKAVVAFLLCVLLRQPSRTGLVVGLGLSQIGEFSFILGGAGVQLGMLDPAQYALILAAAIVSISVNPLVFRLLDPLERVAARSPLARWTGGRPRHPDPAAAPGGGGHVVIVGCGRVGGHIVEVLGTMGVPRLVIESDAVVADETRARGVPVLFGDAANSEILGHARLEDARALVVTVPDGAAAGLVVASAREMAPGLPIVARAARAGDMRHLAALGAQDVIQPELEGGLEIVRHTLMRLGFPLRAVHRYADAVRRDSYDAGVDTGSERRALGELLHADRFLEISWVPLSAAGPRQGDTLASLDLRARSGASVIAVQREGAVTVNPAPGFTLKSGDYLGLIGNPGQLDAAEKIL